MVSLLLSYGAAVNQRCAQGWTALHEAVARDNTEICDILVGAGAMLNPAHTYSIPPLNVAAQKGHMRALCYLIDKGNRGIFNTLLSSIYTYIYRIMLFQVPM